MKLRLVCVAASIALLGAALAPVALTPGCTSTPVITTTNGVTYTNIVRTIDPLKVQKAANIIQPAVSRALARAIKNSPQHSVEIGNYARAIGTGFYYVKTSGRFSPAEVIAVLDAATQNLQVSLPDEALDAKAAAEALYGLLFDDDLTVQVPGNGWPMTVCTLFYNAIDQALKQAGQPGINLTN